MDLGHLWAPEGQGTTVGGKGGAAGGGGEPWEEIIHQLTARSVIRDFEKMAEKENDIEHGESLGLDCRNCLADLTPQPLSHRRKKTS